MLDSLFTAVLEMTMKGSLVILAVLLVRLLLRRAPKIISYCLWLVVLLRLLCPVSIQLPVSALPEIAPVTPNDALSNADLSFNEVGAAAIGSVGDLISGGSGVQQIPVKPQTGPQTSVQQPQVQQPVQYISTSAKDIWIFLCAYLWIAGLAAMGAYSLFTTLRLKWNLREAIRLTEKGVYQTDRYDTPFVMGLLKPKIYLPMGLEGKEKLLILTHEQQHIRRLDPLWKALGFLALSIHWFNPLVWVAFICACRDMEMSCDEAVLKKMGADIRGAYAASLLKITTGRRIIAGAPLAFGEGDPKGRIRNLAKWKRPILWISIAAVAACTVLAVCLLTDPVGKETISGGNVYFFGYLDAVQNDKLTLNCEDGNELEFAVNPELALPENVQPGDYVMARGRWNEDNNCYLLSRVEEINLPVYKNEGEAIENAILLVEGNPENNQYAFASFAAVGDERGTPAVGNSREEIITVYGLALYQAYINRNGTLQETSGSHIPVAITFRVDSEGRYRLASYWTPRDGSYYADDIRRKFPGGQVPDTQQYIAAQREECETKAKDRFEIDTDSDAVQGNDPVETQPLGKLNYGDFNKSKVPNGNGAALTTLGRDYSREDAIRDGVVVMEYQNAYANADIWEDFFQKVQKGEPSRVRLLECGENYQNYVEDLLFDGRSFLLITPLYDADGALVTIIESHYSTLYRYEGINYIRFGLSWQNSNWDVEPYWSIRDGSGNPVLAFQYVQWEIPKNPQLPETLISARLMLEDMTLGSITDTAKLDSLYTMIVGAEHVPDARESAVLKPLYLLLQFGDGTQLQIPIAPEGDWMLLNSVIYDYGPGNVERLGEMRSYNALLDMVRHFGLEDWPEEFSTWCKEQGMERPHHSLKVIVGEEPHEH